MHREMKLWWDSNTLTSSMYQKMIPRGLHFKKNTTTVYAPEFVTQWNEILSKSSLELMALIVKQGKTQLTELKEQINR